MLKLPLLKILLPFAGWLPLRGLQLLGAFAGMLLYLSRSRARRVAEENLARCFPEMTQVQQQSLLRDSLNETGRTMAETAFAWTRSPEDNLALLHEVHGRPLVDELSSRGGVIFVLPHLGNWEIINHYLGREFGLTHMFQGSGRPAIDRLILDWRDRTGTRFVPSDRSGIRSLVRTLRQGGAVGVMPDQEPQVHTGVFARFFGIDALTGTLVPGLSRHAAGAVVTYCERLPGARGFRVVFEPLAQPGSAEAINSAIEQAVRTNPAQYLWSYKRFRTRPNGEPDYYAFEDHPIRQLVQTTLLSLALKACSLLTLPRTRIFARLLADLPLGVRQQQIAATNLKLCQLNKPGLAARTKLSFFKTILETPWTWRTDPTTFLGSLEETPEIEGKANGTLVLTPAIGNPEVLARYLGSRYRVAEYYHPAGTTSLDRLLRRQRQALGIRLLAHNQRGRDTLVRQLRRGDIDLVMLQPDQQPRLRGGLFIPFYSCDALTTTAIPELLERTGATLAIGMAIRTQKGFNLSFTPVDLQGEHEPEPILRLANQALEAAITPFVDQYRWSAKRFNIRPAGHPKVYR